MLLLSLLTAFAFGAVVTTALGGHYHFFDAIGHGVIHGNSTTDGYFFTETDSPWLSAPGDPNFNYCLIGDARYGNYADLFTEGSNLCRIWSARVADRVDECYAYTQNYVENHLQLHTHVAHNYGQFGGCPRRLI
jgi:hypothetical protein